MSFRRTTNESDQWRQYYRRHETLINQLSRLASLFSSSSNFEEFLETGSFQSNEQQILMSGLTNEEWAVFQLFVTEYSKDGDTYFVSTLNHAYFTELEHRS